MQGEKVESSFVHSDLIFLCFVRGSKVWKRMEIKKTCPGRTWQSMRHRWMKYISKKLGTFRVTMEELEKRDEFTTGPSLQSV